MTTDTASLIGAGDNPAGPVRAGEVVADKYVVERTLGVGGMGVVVAARDRVLDRPVAIKFLLPKLAGSETAAQRFVREARAATRITSEHVARLLEIEKLPNGAPFLVMEYLEGSDLRALVRERGALPANLAVDYVLQALQAVAEGHVHGIVHRDLKPSNLFLTRRADGTPLIKVLDFGIAKTTEREQPESTALTSSDDVRLGSPAYMPPEQLQDPRNVDTRSDIWSLGATLYELLCGQPPFEGKGYLELATRILKEPPTPLSQRTTPSPLPSGLESVLRRCLQKDRAERYANAAELAAALAPFGGDDSRISLTRVNGLFGSVSSLSAVTRAVSIESGDCEPTLDLAGETGRERRTSDLGAVASEPPSAVKRSGFVLAVVAVGALAFVVHHQTSRRALPASGAAPPQTTVIEPPDTEPKPPEPSSAPQPPKLGPSDGPVAVLAPPDAQAKSPPVLPAKIKLRAPTQLARQESSSDRQSQLTSTPPEAPASAEPPPAAEPPSSSTLGRSVEIERLIERRH
jgi:serine/threonine-protein kinase